MNNLKIEQTNNLTTWIIRLTKGEKLVESLEEFAKEKNITFAKISGIGALENTDYGLYEDGEYILDHIKRTCELNSLNGNISIKDNKPFFHGHFTISYIEKGTNHTIGGHIFEATIAVTAEIFITSYKDVVIERKIDPLCEIVILDVDKKL